MSRTSIISTTIKARVKSGPTLNDITQAINKAKAFEKAVAVAAEQHGVELIDVESKPGTMKG